MKIVEMKSQGKKFGRLIAIDNVSFLPVRPASGEMKVSGIDVLSE